MCPLEDKPTVSFDDSSSGTKATKKGERSNGLSLMIVKRSILDTIYDALWGVSWCHKAIIQRLRHNIVWEYSE